MKNWLKHIIYFPLFFFLMYMGPRIYLGPVKFIIIWKLIILFILILLILKKGRKINWFIRLGYLYALKMWISIGALMYISDTIDAFSKFLVLPVVAHYSLNIITKENLVKFFNFLQYLSIYIILSSIPFLFHLLEPNSKGYDFEKYGSEGYGFTGIFQNPHTAAILLSVSILILFFFTLQTNNIDKKFFYVFLMLLGLYVEYKTYVRTGYSSLIAGWIFIGFKHQRFKTKVLMFVLALGMGAVATYLYENDTVLQMRLSDKNIYKTNVTENDLGSGRVYIYKNNLKNYISSDFFDIIFGLGRERAKLMLKEKIGHALVSHSGFLDALVDNGVIGFLLFLVWLYSAYKTIKKSTFSYFKPLAYGIFFSYVAVMLTQGGNKFFLDIIFSVVVIISFSFSERKSCINYYK